MILKILSISIITAFCLTPIGAEISLPLQGRTIMVDPGHGTLNYSGKIINPGKTTRKGAKEHNLNVEISQKLGEKLKAAGAKVYFTRTDFNYWREGYSSQEDNKSRAIFANEVGVDILLSIHCDWHPNRKVHGVTTLHAKKNSQRLGEIIQRNMVKTLKARNRKVVKDDFTILDNAEMPAVIIETGFMSHWKESKKLKNSAYQEKIAGAITTALKRYFN